MKRMPGEATAAPKPEPEETGREPDEGGNDADDIETRLTKGLEAMGDEDPDPDEPEAEDEGEEPDETPKGEEAEPPKGEEGEDRIREGEVKGLPPEVQEAANRRIDKITAKRKTAEECYRGHVSTFANCIRRKRPGSRLHSSHCARRLCMSLASSGLTCAFSSRRLTAMATAV